jgi:alkanesulfonate monooxygenase SsuD/methylene tetrahydromethanopterin reductase-like flavin-dependent oxidoreductase (luciferase family)
MNVVRDEDLAQLFAGLSAISRGRVIMGLGLGGFSPEFAAAGYPSGLHERAELVRATLRSAGGVPPRRRIRQPLDAGPHYPGDFSEAEDL